jgi:hypothetical protein
MDISQLQLGYSCSACELLQYCLDTPAQHTTSELPHGTHITHQLTISGYSREFCKVQIVLVIGLTTCLLRPVVRSASIAAW